MPFSHAELRHRAADFVRQHADDHDEKSQAQTLLRDFFDVFAPQVHRRFVAFPLFMPLGAVAYHSS